jgi:hypothetical protein
MNERHVDIAVSVPPAHDALRFVILLGVTSLFADMTYEGARSITGPYLGLLGASVSVGMQLVAVPLLIGILIYDRKERPVPSTGSQL